MKMKFLFSMFSVFFLIAGTSAAQTTDRASYYGNLLRISMFADSVSPSDTLGNWEDIKYWENSRYGDPGRQYSFYYDHLSLPNHSYLLKQKEWYMFYTYFESYGGENLLETEGEKTDRGFSYTDVAMGDVLPPLMIEMTEVIPTSSGSWLVNGSLGNAFIGDNDSLYIFNALRSQPYNQDTLAKKFVSILGWTDKGLVCVFWKGSNKDEVSEYRLVDFSMPPNITEQNSRIIKFTGNPGPGDMFYAYKKVKKVKDDIYLAQTSGAIHFYKFADASFNYIKPLLNQGTFGGSQSRWELRNNRLYSFSGKDLVSFDFNLSDTTFINERVLLSSGSYWNYSIGVDRNFKYAARIDGDSLKIYDIDKERYINSISIAGINRPVRPVVDSPYVYLHQTTRMVTDVINEKIQAVKSYTLSAYPNPFNPVTTLEFDIPTAGKVELKVYDVLGKEVTTLVNEERKAGSYKVQFNASSLPSGIYLCRMNAGKYSVTKKVVLLK